MKILKNLILQPKFNNNGATKILSQSIELTKKKLAIRIFSRDRNKQNYSV
jgi:hypothetical protein